MLRGLPLGLRLTACTCGPCRRTPSPRTSGVSKLRGVPCIDAAPCPSLLPRATPAARCGADWADRAIALLLALPRRPAVLDARGDVPARLLLLLGCSAAISCSSTRHHRCFSISENSQPSSSRSGASRSCGSSGGTSEHCVEQAASGWSRCSKHASLAPTTLATNVQHHLHRAPCATACLHPVQAMLTASRCRRRCPRRPVRRTALLVQLIQPAARTAASCRCCRRPHAAAGLLAGSRSHRCVWALTQRPEHPAQLQDVAPPKGQPARQVGEARSARINRRGSRLVACVTSAAHKAQRSTHSASRAGAPPVHVTRGSPCCGLDGANGLQPERQPLLRPQAQDGAGQAAGGRMQLAAGTRRTAAGTGEGPPPTGQVDCRLRCNKGGEVRSRLELKQRSRNPQLYLNAAPQAH